MRLEAKTRLQAATFTFQDKVANPMERSYLLVTVHGKDGASNTVCTGQKPNGFFCVFVVSSKGQLLAESAMNMVKADAVAMAKHAVATKAKVYQDEDSVFDPATVPEADADQRIERAGSRQPYHCIKGGNAGICSQKKPEDGRQFYDAADTGSHRRRRGI